MERTFETRTKPLWFEYTCNSFLAKVLCLNAMFQNAQWGT